MRLSFLLRLPAVLMLAGLALWGSLTGAGAQSIPRHDQPRFTLDGNLPGTRDGHVVLMFGVSMSDCIGDIELENVRTRRKYYLRPTLDNYYVRDNDMEEIYAKVTVGKFRRLYSKKHGLVTKVRIRAKGGRVVYLGQVELPPMDTGEDDEEEESGYSGKSAHAQQKHKGKKT